MRTRPLPVLATVLPAAVAVGSVLLTGCDSGPRPVVLVDPGAGDRVDLRPDLVPGTTWEQRVEVASEADQMGQRVASTVVYEADAQLRSAGDPATWTRQLTDARVTRAPAAIRREYAALVADLPGRTFVSEHGRIGLAAGEPRWTGGPVEALTPDDTLLVVPDEPVGEGATWTAAEQRTVDPVGAVPVRTTYRLVDLADGHYEISMTFEGDVDADLQGVGYAGAVSGSGTITGAVGEPLPASVRHTVTLTLSGEYHQDLALTTRTEATAEPGTPPAHASAAP